MELGHTLLHLALTKEEILKGGRGAEVAKILILNGANVILRDMGDRTCIEMAAANGCTVDHFKLLWDSALRAGAFYKPNKVIGEIIDAASWSYSHNEPVLEFSGRSSFKVKLCRTIPY
jgi:ankyrin repeat protein